MSDLKVYYARDLHNIGEGHLPSKAVFHSQHVYLAHNVEAEFAALSEQLADAQAVNGQLMAENEMLVEQLEARDDAENVVLEYAVENVEDARAVLTEQLRIAHTDYGVQIPALVNAIEALIEAHIEKAK